MEALSGGGAEATDKELAEATVRGGTDQYVEAAGDPMISFSHVNISFNGRAVLEDMSFSGRARPDALHPGPQRRGQVGVSAHADGLSEAGLRLDPRRGPGDRRPDEEGMKAIRKRVTMVFQNGALFDSLSVRENVAFPLRERGGLDEDQIHQIVDRLISMVGAEDVEDALPASLSTGRKRAVAIARALAAQPEVVLYDEPTTMVDPIIARRLGDLIQRLKQQLGFTSIVVTHDMRFAERLADTVLFLHQGRATYFGPLSGFMASADPNIRRFLALDAYVVPSV